MASMQCEADSREVARAASFQHQPHAQKQAPFTRQL